MVSKDVHQAYFLRAPASSLPGGYQNTHLEISAALEPRSPPAYSVYPQPNASATNDYVVDVCSHRIAFVRRSDR